MPRSSRSWLGLELRRVWAGCGLLIRLGRRRTLDLELDGRQRGQHTGAARKLACAAASNSRSPGRCCARSIAIAPGAASSRARVLRSDFKWAQGEDLLCLLPRIARTLLQLAQIGAVDAYQVCGEPSGLVHSVSPAARRRPDSNSSRCSGLRKNRSLGMTWGVMPRSRATICWASSSRPR